jgi:regulator of protease activity HflC (stomatin/prohibitin superfamily)
MYYVLIGLVVFVLIIIISGIKIVPQSQAWVVERFGGYNATWNVGFHIMIPFIDRIAKKVSLKEGLFDYEPQPVITKDNVTMLVDSVVFYQIADAKLYTYGVENPKLAIDKLTTTTLRNVVGELELDETLTSRDTINGKLRSILDEATDAWGIKVNRVEVKNIDPPESIKDAMEKQMRAERERRAAILAAEGEKQSSILKAEGEKQALILQAEAKKEAAVREAEGEAQAILSVQKATADGLEMIKTAIGIEGALKLKSFEALEKVADGQATKIIIPSDLQNIAGLVTGRTELAGR